MFSFCAGVRFGLLFENTLVFLLSSSLSGKSGMVHVAKALDFSYRSS